jgi:formate/nitrite transporter FocA (FNT family)
MHALVILKVCISYEALRQLFCCCILVNTLGQTFASILSHVPEASCIAGNSTYLLSAMTYKAHSLSEEPAVWLQSGIVFLSKAVLQVTAHTCRQQ